MPSRITSACFLCSLVLMLAFGGAACTNNAPANANTTTTNTATTNTSTTTTNTATTTATTTINAREPEQYRATMVITGQTTGNNQTAASFSIDVARNGSDRYYAFKNLPGIGQINYIDRADKSYVVIPSQRQYFEVTPETTGFKVPRAMTPGMMVEQLQHQQGVTLVGEEQLNGRTVTKYRFAGTTQTGSQAGQVSGESFVYVDKETGLPLRAEGSSAAQGNVQGVSGGHAVMEMRDLQTSVDPSLFEVPQDYKKLTPEQVQAQMRAALAIVQALAGGMGGGMGGGAQTNTPPANTGNNNGNSNNSTTPPSRTSGSPTTTP